MKQNFAEMIARLNRSLAQDFRIMPLDAPEAPIFLSIALPTSEVVTGLKPRLPAGRGLSMQQAMIAAGAEALELRASLAQRHAVDLAKLTRVEGFATLPARDMLSGMIVPVRAQEVFLDCATTLSEPLSHDANSTGCAVGPSVEAAAEVALWECVERDAVALWWHGHAPARLVALDVIDALQPRLFWWLHQRDRSTMLLDITTDIGLPAVAAISAGADGSIVAMGSAARPLLADAALAAVTEMVQTEVSMDLARQAGDPEVLAWINHASTKRQAQFQPKVGGSVTEAPPMTLDHLLRRLADLGHQALAVELTLPEDPMPCMRVLVPGLCAMGPRIDTPRFARLCPDQRTPQFPEPF
jgi:thiazole/oxazole-forming peptide maturase SagD family component